MQRNEYTRYQRDISRRKGKLFVLTGTASLFRTYALKAVADSRGDLLPGDPGTVYDTLALTEDNESYRDQPTCFVIPLIALILYFRRTAARSRRGRSVPHHLGERVGRNRVSRTHQQGREQHALPPSWYVDLCFPVMDQQWPQDR